MLHKNSYHSNKNKSYISKQMKKKQRKKSAFTLIEIIIVVALISIMVGAILPKIKPNSIDLKETQMESNKALFVSAAQASEKLSSHKYTSTQSLVYDIYQDLLNNKALNNISNPYDSTKKGIGYSYASSPNLSVGLPFYVLMNEPSYVPKGVNYYVVKTNPLPSDPLSTSISQTAAPDNLSIGGGSIIADGLPPEGQTEMGKVVNGVYEVWYVDQLYNCDGAPTTKIKIMRSLDFREDSHYVNPTTNKTPITSGTRKLTLYGREIQGNGKSIISNSVSPIFNTVSNSVIENLTVSKTVASDLSVLTINLTDSTLRNINIFGDISDSVYSSRIYTGLAASQARAATLINVNARGNLTTTTNSFNFAGGLIGTLENTSTQSNPTTILDSSYAGTIYAYYTSGLVGYSYPTTPLVVKNSSVNLTSTSKPDSYTAGIVTKAYNLTVSNCDISITANLTGSSGGSTHILGGVTSESNGTTSITDNTINIDYSDDTSRNIFAFGGVVGSHPSGDLTIARNTIQSFKLIIPNGTTTSTDLSSTSVAIGIGGIVGCSTGATLDVTNNTVENVNINARSCKYVSAVCGLVNSTYNISYNKVLGIASIFSSSDTGAIVGMSYLSTSKPLTATPALNYNTVERVSIACLTNAGGIIGSQTESSSTEIIGNTVGKTGTSFNGTISGSTCAGGIAGNTIAPILASTVTNTSFYGYRYIGGISGSTLSSIQDCSVSGLTIKATSYIGGISGEATSLSNCSVNTTTLTSDNTTSTSAVYIGGLVGFLRPISQNGSSNVTKSYSTASITASFGTYTGGLVGSGSSGTVLSNITNSYYNGTMTLPNNPNYTATICYNANVSNCYNIVTFTGAPTTVVSAKTYLNAYAYSPTVSTGTTSAWKSLTQMKTQSTYSGFDFTNTWIMDKTKSPYPTLRP